MEETWSERARRALRGDTPATPIFFRSFLLSITSLSSYSSLYANGLLNSIASSASNKGNAVQAFEMGAPASSGDDSSISDETSESGASTPVRHHGRHHTETDSQNSSAADALFRSGSPSAAGSSSSNSAANSLSQILGTNFNFVGL
jgi:hypothetical protein